MKDNQYQEGRKSDKMLWIMLVASIICFATGVITFVKHDSIAKIISDNTETICTDTVKTVDTVYTVQNILDFRENLKEGIRIDSMFLTMPEPILVEILMNHGTLLSNKDIVYIYEGNKDYYNSILKGANIQRDILTPRDTITNKTIP